MTKTILKKLTIRKFRALADIEIELGTHITVICGKNGTSKSSILGIAAQIFSFEKDYSTNTALSYQTITGENFKSLPREHFRFSSKFDVPGSLDVGVEIFDGYTNGAASADLGLFSRGGISRPVVRKNTTGGLANRSRNFTHPVIFLSLKRLQPIAFRDYSKKNFTYLTNHVQDFINLNNELLNKNSSIATGTGGSINSAVAYANHYDQDSVSAGEDNAGQIILALMSFKKLKSEYSDYKGGLLLIDEADAGLFPAAQTMLLDILEKECSTLNLQVILTSHSPTLIEKNFESSKKFQRKFKNIYLSDTFGPIQAMQDFSWMQIYSDLLTATIETPQNSNLPLINTYFEDKEGSDFFNTLIFRHPAKKFLKQLPEISMGCSNYIQLIKKGVPEFSSHSLIVLDGDVDEGIKYSSIALLPGSLPPDQLIFEFLYNLPPSDPFWKNPIGFTRPVFTQISAAIKTALSISGASINLADLIETYHTLSPSGQPKLRDIFKAFYKNAQFQKLLLQKNIYHPWKRWMKDNPIPANEFREIFAKKITDTMHKGFGVDMSKLIFLQN